MITTVCLALALYHEAGNGNADDMRAVGEVVMNRVADDRYPATVCEVVFEDDQFAWTTMPEYGPTDNVLEQRAWEQAEDVARSVLSGDVFGTTSTHFHTRGHPLAWAASYDADGCVGGNCFYTNNTPWR